MSKVVDGLMRMTTRITRRASEVKRMREKQKQTRGRNYFNFESSHDQCVVRSHTFSWLCLGGQGFDFDFISFENVDL